MACGELLGFLIIGALAGWLAGKLMRGRGFGLLGNLVVGILGAMVGGLLLNLIGMQAYGFIGRLIMSLLGAVVLLGLINLIRTDGPVRG